MDMQCEASAQVEQCDRESQPQFNVCGNRGDAECCPACPFYSLGGNTFHCQQHLGAVHVCDMRCRFRALDMGPNCDQIQYRCMISGLSTKNRLMVPSDVTNKRALNFAEQGDHSGAQWGASKRRGLAARLFPAAQ